MFIHYFLEEGIDGGEIKYLFLLKKEEKGMI